ncbi:DUF692 domain-containing protein [Luteibacter aegosomatissinici]|uniref:MNIO family bufferin maturase n=1 Tax=Luteibacter aegosomatissinici TaxID=2911539 RepID=UPI001FF8BA7B|nr:DUF692 domain-containing protein [Luteibacter aegosomatissinici]UPG96049.1 DUF692 domain-containing protein [Luteibacter aegosomatissinici]
MAMTTLPTFHGFGLGLRVPHYPDVLATKQPLDFVEVISENFMVDGGRPLHILEQVRASYPLALHGVSMNIGAGDGLDMDYLKQLRRLADRFDPLWVSDHVCWTAVDGIQAHDLLPLPYSDEALDVVSRNVMVAQDVLGRPLVLENPSTYLEFPGSMSEAEFLAALCKRTGCYLLLDVNNIVVSATNHGRRIDEWLDHIPLDRVRQIHLAGHSQGRDLLIDTHDAPVPTSVWELYQRFLSRLGPVASMIERDDHIPPFAELLDELNVARRVAAIAAAA